MATGTEGSIWSAVRIEIVLPFIIGAHFERLKDYEKQ